MTLTVTVTVNSVQEFGQLSPQLSNSECRQRGEAIHRCQFVTGNARVVQGGAERIIAVCSCLQ